MYSYDCTTELSAVSTPVFKVRDTHDSSEIIIICWFGDQETLIIIVNVENSCAA